MNQCFKLTVILIYFLISIPKISFSKEIDNNLQNSFGGCWKNGTNDLNWNDNNHQSQELNYTEFNSDNEKNLIIFTHSVPEKKSKNISLEKKIFFEFGNCNVISENLKLLNQTIEEIKKLNYINNIHVIGYTDSIGSKLYNKQLSAKRADRIRSYLEDKGILKEKILIQSMGENEPENSNSTSNGRAKNRYVKIVVVGSE